MKKTAPVFQVSLIRSLTNGWTTSARAHGCAQACALGCAQADSIAHYMQCHTLWAAIARCTELEPAPSRPARLGLAPSSPGFDKVGRFAPPPASVFQLALASDVVQRCRGEPSGRVALQSRVRDAIRRIRPA